MLVAVHDERAERRDVAALEAGLLAQLAACSRFGILAGLEQAARECKTRASGAVLVATKHDGAVVGGQGDQDDEIRQGDLEIVVDLAAIGQQDPLAPHRQARTGVERQRTIEDAPGAISIHDVFPCGESPAAWDAAGHAPLQTMKLS